MERANAGIAEQQQQNENSMLEEVRLALIKNHRFRLTEWDREIILRLKNQNRDNSAHDSSRSSTATGDTVIYNVASTSNQLEGERTLTPTQQLDESANASAGERTLTPTQQAEADADSEIDIAEILINYIVRMPRLFFCYEAITWQELRSDHYDIRDDYTCEELRDEFITCILPKIYTFDLNEATKNAFKILELSTSFERIPTGYLVNPLKIYAIANMPIVRDVDYMVIDVRETAVGSCGTASAEQAKKCAKNAMQPFVMDTQKSNPAPPQIAIVVGDSNFYETGRHTRPTTLTPKNWAICSAIVSHDYELFNSVLHDSKTILERLRFFKQRFAQTGQLSENFNAQRLREKYEKYMELRSVIADFCNRRFSINAMEDEEATS